MLAFVQLLCICWCGLRARRCHWSSLLFLFCCFCLLILFCFCCCGVRPQCWHSSRYCIYYGVVFVHGAGIGPASLFFVFVAFAHNAGIRPATVYILVWYSSTALALVQPFFVCVAFAHTAGIRPATVYMLVWHSSTLLAEAFALLILCSWLGKGGNCAAVLTCCTVVACCAAA